MLPNGGASSHGSIPLSEKINSFSILRSECCMFKVHNHLREINKKAYEPEIIAIGPYHHKKDSLLMMEEHKLRYLHLLLQRKNENLGKYLLAIKPLEKQIRECYAEPISLNSDQLVEMMVLDGCFIVELVRKYNMIHVRDKDDPIFQMKWIMNSLQRDLMLFENQVPFFVLRELFNMIEVSNEKRFIHLLLSFFCDLLPDPRRRWYASESSHGEVKHLLDLIHINWLSSVDGGKFGEAARNGDKKSDEDSGKNRSDRTFIHCATQLREVGVKFEKKDGLSLFDISSQKGTLQIPSFTVDDRTESFLRNLIAHEQYCKTNRVTIVTDYVKLLDCLIDSSKDVEILSRFEIIDNWLGDSEVVSSIFNKMTDSVILQSNSFCYERIFKEVNAHCKRSWNWWMAKLRRNYLNSPWGLISILAATILLLLTLTQTTFTVFPRK